MRVASGVDISAFSLVEEKSLDLFGFISFSFRFRFAFDSDSFRFRFEFISRSDRSSLPVSVSVLQPLLRAFDSRSIRRRFERCSRVC